MAQRSGGPDPNQRYIPNLLPMIRAPQQQFWVRQQLPLFTTQATGGNTAYQNINFFNLPPQLYQGYTATRTSFPPQVFNGNGQQATTRNTFPPPPVVNHFPPQVFNGNGQQATTRNTFPPPPVFYNPPPQIAPGSNGTRPGGIV